jgi:hypothetical protein
MKTYGGVKVQIHEVLTSAVSDQPYTLAALQPGTGTRCKGTSMGRFARCEV